jgi:hypothetical protein
MFHSFFTSNKWYTVFNVCQDIFFPQALAVAFLLSRACEFTKRFSFAALRIQNARFYFFFSRFDQLLIIVNTYLSPNNCATLHVYVILSGRKYYCNLEISIDWFTFAQESLAQFLRGSWYIPLNDLWFVGSDIYD